jgi:hypothetical protein
VPRSLISPVGRGGEAKGGLAGRRSLPALLPSRWPLAQVPARFRPPFHSNGGCLHGCRLLQCVGGEEATPLAATAERRQSRSARRPAQACPNRAANRSTAAPDRAAPSMNTPSAASAGVARHSPRRSTTKRTASRLGIGNRNQPRSPSIRLSRNRRTVTASCSQESITRASAANSSAESQTGLEAPAARSAAHVPETASFGERRGAGSRRLRRVRRPV